MLPAMQSNLDLIRARTSVRAYAPTTLDDATRAALNRLMQQCSRGPLGNPVRYALLDLDEEDRREARQFGTYGFIRGARVYILCAIEDRPGAREDLGHCMERVILGATGLGLGTCWMGGTFKRGRFARRMGLSEGEFLPVISPVGHPRKKRTLVERAIRVGAGSDRRKPFEQLFFIGEAMRPAAPADAGDLGPCLEAVRLGPSASNKQPWRVVLEDDARAAHFFLRRTRGYERMFGGINLQNIDIGIAMCHHELAAQELGLAGAWDMSPPAFCPPGSEYIVSWRRA